MAVGQRAVYCSGVVVGLCIVSGVGGCIASCRGGGGVGDGVLVTGSACGWVYDAMHACNHMGL